MVRTETGLIFTILLATAMACTDSKAIDDQSFTLPGSGWQRTYMLEGTWTTDKSIPNGKVVLRIFHTQDYDYQNIYLAGTVSRNGNKIQSDTFSIQLARPNNGRWLGEKQGKMIFVTDTLHFTLSLDAEVTYDFKFSQFSREQVLQGIEKVDVQVIEN